MNGLVKLHFTTRSFHPSLLGNVAEGHLLAQVLPHLDWPLRPTTGSQRQEITKVVDESPVTPSFLPRAGFRVEGGPSATCEAGSDSTGNDYRCFAGNDVYDPCWTDDADPSKPSVICQEDPWRTTVEHLMLSAGGLPPFLSGAATDQAPWWGLELGDGERCAAVQGAHDAFDGRIVDYSCGSTYHHVLLRGLDRSRPVWTAVSAFYSSSTNAYITGPVERIATAWHAVQDDGSATADAQDECTASALAFAAQRYEVAHHDPEGALPAVTAQACDDGYAILVFTQMAPPPRYTASMLFRAALSGWHYVGEADDIMPGSFGAPAATIIAINAALRRSPMNEDVPF